jgi:F-type H+-transporting ATPase subunit delta
MSTAAKVYAKAVFDLGQEKGQLDAFQNELSGVSEALVTSPALKSVLTGSGINPNTRNAVLADVASALGLGPVVRKLMEMLVLRGRVAELPEIRAELESLVERSQGVQAGKVRTAVDLSSEELSVLEAALTKRVGKKVKLSQEVDPSLLGGMVAVVAGKTFDASLRSQLERFKSEMI